MEFPFPNRQEPSRWNARHPVKRAEKLRQTNAATESVTTMKMWKLSGGLPGRA